MEIAKWAKSFFVVRIYLLRNLECLKPHSSSRFIYTSMALNPPLTQSIDPSTEEQCITPTPYESEFFFLMRDSLSFSLTDPSTSATYKATGRLYLTSNRLCFLEKGMCKLGGRPLIHSKTGQEWAGVDLPLEMLINHKFGQPIFGANYLGGECSVVAGGGFGGDRVKFRCVRCERAKPEQATLC